MRKKVGLLVSILLVVSGLLFSNYTSDAGRLGALDDGEALVRKVVDGDTIEVEDRAGRKKVRYIGIDTPETVDPRRPVGCFGKRASDENKKLVEYGTVFLEKDISDTDKYGRLLRYVYIERDGAKVFVNDYLVRNGFAFARTFPPDIRYESQFRAAEREAREKNFGLWSECKG